jgi:hypothetical protein
MKNKIVTLRLAFPLFLVFAIVAPIVTFAQSTVSAQPKHGWGEIVLEFTQQAKASIAHFAREKLYKGKNETEVYAAVLKHDMYYNYIAFSELFPNSEHIAEIKEKLRNFRQIASPKNKEIILSDKDLKDRLNWNGEEQLYYYADELIAIINDPKTGQRLITGPACLGNLQFHGTWAYEQDGLHLKPGSTIIYKWR